MRRGLITGIFLVTAILAGCGSEQDAGSIRSATDQLADPGPVHVHGLGVNPADSALFIATHTGVWRLPAGSDEATRVADLYQDTMGFAVVGPNHFVGSGHPGVDADLPPFLGFIESRNAARTWDQVSLLGETDFHVLEVLGQRVYGFGSDFQSGGSRFMVSTDRGRSWSRRKPPEPLISLAIDPRDPDRAVASGESGLFRTDDAGSSWRKIGARPGLLAWSNDGLYLVTQDGSMLKAKRPGSRWSEVGEAGGPPAAFESTSEGLFAALHDGTIRWSRDGSTWTDRYSP